MRTDFEKMISTFDIAGISYRVTPIYDENNNEHKAIWFDRGHLEFDGTGRFTNAVDY